MNPTTSLVLRGDARARGGGANPYVARVKGSVRYADPMAWTLVLAVGEVLESLGEDFRASADRCSLIQVGPEAPPEAMSSAAREALRGFASPIRFPAAPPSAPTGLACIVHGIRGPTLALTLPVAEGAGLALSLSTAWLTRGVVDYALIATAASVPGEAPRAACVVLSRGEGPPVDPARLVQSLLFSR
ncbi:MULTISPECIES: coronafacic acid synthetase [unclassified Myxococcus]|uniref:coronafacic acid synthetase n=1 Tax=unclassified Myxococcus TaxID=2648731 RepID=UPI001CC137AE|nr:MULTISPECIES: coronafacic acid synthetase [unclassified Myxococcus]MBZ4401171.1 coronafacic acid synthetase [Myxococcus sp. AS-1-15]MBZ4410980.1 coronafacic acid synthetase [Myxococcus sp. XM-1-1-1]